MAYSTGQDVTTSEMLHQLNLFVASLNPTYWQVVCQNEGNYTTGQAGNPLVVKHSNGYDPKSSGVEDDCYIHIWRRDSNDIGMNLATEYAGSATGNDVLWYNQVGARKGENFDSIGDDVYCKTSHGASPIKQYHFFGYDEHTYVVWQNESNGLWRNFGFGHLDKIDTFDGGGFCCASWCVENTTSDGGKPVVDSSSTGGYVQFFNSYETNYSNSNSHVSQVRVDNLDVLRYVLGTSEVSVTDSNWERAAGANDTYGFDGNPYYPSTTSDPITGPFEANKVHEAPSAFGLTSPLVPIYTYINRGSNKRSLYGSLPHLFCLNIKDIVETSEIDIQGDTYMVFPASKKTNVNGNDNTNLPNSYRYGFCIKKVV